MPIGQLDPTVMIRLRQLVAQREAEKELQKLVEPPRMTRPSGLPDVPPPAMVRNLGINTPRAALIKALEQIQQIAPQAGVGVHTLTSIPDRGILNDMTRAGLNPAEFNDRPLYAGAVNRVDPGRVYVNIDHEGNPGDTLAHELTHQAGIMDSEEVPEHAADLWAKLDPRGLDERGSALNWDLFRDFWRKR